MGSWGSWSAGEAIVCPSASEGVGTTLKSMDPGEKHQVGVKRTDAAAAGDDWRVCVQLTINGTPEYGEDPPAWCWRLKATQTKWAFIIAGVKEYRIWIENADGTPVDVPAATVYIVEDGVSI